MYINELSPWERKEEYYNNIQIGKDTKTQIKAISQSSKDMIAAQRASTTDLINSNERINEGIDNLSYGIEKIEDGMQGLKAAFEWGISEVVWQIEQNRKELQSILKILSAPLDTQAKELRKRAEEAYANGWYEDALEDFLESEIKNRYDFSIHISIGIIYFFHKVNRDKALDYFEKAVKYATPKSKYHASIALLYKALIKRDFNLIEDAERSAAKAVELTPNFAEAIYQCAQYNALLKRPDKSLRFLREAITFDINYCEKAYNDDAFDLIKPQLYNLFNDLKKAEGIEAQNNLVGLKKRLKKFDNYLFNAKDIVKVEESELDRLLSRLSNLMKRNSYRDFREANILIKKLHSLIENQKAKLAHQLQCLKESNNADISRVKRDKNDKTKNISNKFMPIIPIGVGLSFLFGIKGCWSLGPGAIGTGREILILEPIWVLIWRTALGAAIAAVIYFITICIYKMSLSKATQSRIAGSQSKTDRIDTFINNLKKI